jgi:hypothetical protein
VLCLQHALPPLHTRPLVPAWLSPSFPLLPLSPVPTCTQRRCLCLWTAPCSLHPPCIYIHVTHYSIWCSRLAQIHQPVSWGSGQSWSYTLAPLPSWSPLLMYRCAARTRVPPVLHRPRLTQPPRAPCQHGEQLLCGPVSAAVCEYAAAAVCVNTLLLPLLPPKQLLSTLATAKGTSRVFMACKLDLERMLIVTAHCFLP